MNGLYILEVYCKEGKKATIKVMKY
jgi:hypothetical protein